VPVTETSSNAAVVNVYRLVMFAIVYLTVAIIPMKIAVQMANAALLRSTVQQVDSV